MSKKQSLESFPSAYQKLQKELAQTGWIALGTLLERGLPGQGGPRYQWSRRAGGKTVTVALSEEQYRWMEKAVANQRRVWDILIEMQEITTEFMIQNLPNPPRRKRLSKKRLGLN